MPYIITTHELDETSGMPGPPMDRPRAVATLDEAREEAYWIAFHSDRAPGQEDDAYAITESGGTIGPLPDGTVIEVERVGWPALAATIDHPWPAADRPAVFGRMLDAYNTRQTR